MRTISLLFLTLRILWISVFIYQFTKIVGPQKRSLIRSKVVLWSARQVAKFFVKMGGIYIKAAQFMATASNLFDAEFTEIFSRVQDEVEPRPYEMVKYRFLAEFGTDPENLYLEFDRNAIAAASLGQVHIARIRDGRRVAVKFLHPNIEGQIRRDLRALRLAISLILWFYPHLNFRSHLNEFSNMLLSEIDYQNEAENMRRIRHQFADDAKIVIPEVIENLSGATVLTTEFIQGIRISDLDELDRRNVDRRQLGELLVEAYSRMIFDDRFYHADPHPGNIFVIPSDGANPLRLAFVDFGAAQNISERTFQQLERVAEIMKERDFPAFIDFFVEIGLITQDADKEVYTNLFELIYSRYGSFKIDDVYRINPVRFGRLIKMRDLGVVGLRLRHLLTQIKLPKRYIYLSRTITMLLSLTQRLDDKVNIFMVAKPHVEKYLHFKRELNPLKTMQAAVKRILRPEGGKLLPVMQSSNPIDYRPLFKVALLMFGGTFLGIVAIYMRDIHLDAARSLGIGAGLVFVWAFRLLWKK